MSGIDWAPRGGGVWGEWYGEFRSLSGAHQHLVRWRKLEVWEVRRIAGSDFWEVRVPEFSS